MTGDRVRFDFYPDDEFLNGAVALADLSEWAKAKRLHLPHTSARVTGAEIVGIQTYLKAVAEQAVAGQSDQQVLGIMSDILKAQPAYPCHHKERSAVLEERDERTARWLLEGSVWVVWRDLIRQALDDGELPLIQGITLAPIAWPGGPASTPAATAAAVHKEEERAAKPWLIVDPVDPPPAQAWYTPARYFARQLVLKDSTLLTKRLLLAEKVSQSLSNAGICKRGRKGRHAPETVLKAFSNVALG
jgi:hypothetical protein